MSLKYLNETNSLALKVMDHAAGLVVEAADNNAWKQAEKAANSGDYLDRLIGIAKAFKMKNELDILMALSKYHHAVGHKPRGSDDLIDREIGYRMVYQLDALKPTEDQWRMVVWGLPYDALKDAADTDLTVYRRDKKEDDSEGEGEGDSNEGNIEWGFDLTSFENAKNFLKLLKGLGMKDKPSRSKDGYFIWSGPGITMTTGNDPISGAYHNNNRENEVGYASYIGLEGKPSLVKKAVAYIRKFDPKDESPNSRDFI
jgi:hypothetical protein